MPALRGGRNVPETPRDDSSLETRSVILQARITPRTYAAVVEAARIDRRSVSEWGRLLIVDYICQLVEEGKLPPEFRLSGND